MWLLDWAHRHSNEIKASWGKDGKQLLETIADAAGIPKPVSTHQYFDAFWKSYPATTRKVDKAGCQRKWSAMGLDESALDILAALEKAKASEDWTKQGGAYIPAPAVWLNQRRWEALLTPAVNPIFAGSFN